MAPTSTRSIRRPSIDGTTFSSCSSHTKHPILNSAVIQAAAPVIYEDAMGTPDTDPITLPVDPIQLIPTYKAALAAFEQLPEIRVLFDNGAGTSPTGTSGAGDPYPGFEQDFSSFPIPGTVATTWYLGPNGTLSSQAPNESGVNWYTSNAGALALTDYGTNTGAGGLWGNASQWQWNWEQNPSGSAVSYVSAPLTTDTTVIGGGAVYLWVESSTPDVDLQATISEVRPDGNETFVQNGWIQASERKLSTGSDNEFDTPSTTLDPIPSFRESRRRAHAGRQVRRGRHSALLRRACLPCGIAHPRDHLRAERHATRLVVRPDGPQWHGDGLRQILPVHAVEPRSPGHSGRAGSDVSAGMPESAQRAMQALRTDNRQRGHLKASPLSDARGPRDSEPGSFRSRRGISGSTTRQSPLWRAGT